MAGPYPEHPQPYPGQETHPTEQAAAAAVYPGMLPPPVPYPKRRRWRVTIVVLLVVAVIAGASVTIVYAVRSNGHATNQQLSDASAKTAIQSYLNALSAADIDSIARNTLCGMYDAVKDRRSDEALAKLSSDAFRKQFSKAEVTSIDKVVYWSPVQAQVLFTMRVTPPTRGAASHEEQGVAQILAQDNSIMVCSYLLRTAAIY
jgi:hypothetical protein